MSADTIHPTTSTVRPTGLARHCPSCGQALANGAWRCASGREGDDRGCGKILGGDHEGVGQRGDGSEH